MRHRVILWVVAGLILFPGLHPWADPAPSKVIVLGFDGADSRLVEQWMDEGKLPNLERLRRQGSYARLRPTNPPQTPVSWSSFSTGLDPGQTTVFDFLKRDPVTYYPDFAMITPSEAPFLMGEKNPLVLGGGLGLLVFLVALGLGYLVFRRMVVAFPLALLVGLLGFLGGRALVARYIPVKQPVAINNRKGDPFWKIAGQAGIRSTIIRVPATFPPGPFNNGRILSGLGVPDIRGTFGTYSYYTSQAPGTGEDTEKGGKVIPLDVEPGVPEVETFVYGPFNKLFDEPPEIHLPMRLLFDWSSQVTRARVSGKEIELKPGQWSDWVEMTFPVNPIIKIHGITRFYLISMVPEFRLYMQAINLNPIKLPASVAVTYPKGFARQIYDRIGYWKTLGWAIDTWALDEEVTDEAVFLEDVDFTVSGFQRIMENFLEDPRDQLYVQIFYFTDRIGHMFWRLMDPEHPAYDEEIDRKFHDTILEAYQRMDRIVGWTLDHMPEDAVLLVCSDHGFSSWKWSFNMNTWLWQNGFLALKGDQNKQKTLDDLFVEGQFWENVDWDRTKAYALGLGAIYINLLGREANGIVPPGEAYEQVRNEIIEKLEAYVDPATGEHPVRRVFKREEMYADFDPELIPDLRAGNNLGYRVSWQTSLGGVPKELFEPHKEKWSGDHCSLDPELVQGIFFSNWVPDTRRQPYIADLCPTILELLGVPVPGGLAGEALHMKPPQRLQGEAEAPARRPSGT
jgi:predicted AlkP superfamily phosphohydrolase/phosphomutase